MRCGCIIIGCTGGVHSRAKQARYRRTTNVARLALPFKTDSATTYLRKLIFVKKTTAKAPTHLRKPTQVWWEGVNAEYALEPHHLKLLTFAAESWDRATQAREAITEHGLTYFDRFGSPRKRPEVSIAEAATIAFARLCRELDLSEDSAPDSRPPSLRSNRG
jgi:phage terminase small subunit